MPSPISTSLVTGFACARIIVLPLTPIIFTYDGLERYVSFPPGFLLPELQYFRPANSSLSIIRGSLETYHGEAVFLNPDSHRVPFHSLFIMQECRVRGRWPFSPNREISTILPYQDWIQVPPDGSLAAKNTETRPPPPPPSSAPSNTAPNTTNQASTNSYFTFTHPFASPEVLDRKIELLRQEQTWKSCIVEGTSWEGTGAENVEKYKALVYKETKD